MILIIGAGLAGLSTAYHLKRKEDYQICEREEEAGGLCRSYEKGGFTFDYTGHLLHLRKKYTRELVERLLPGTLKTLNRRASIYSQDVLTPYPFQANLYNLPKEVVKDCLVGFVEAEIKRASNHQRGPLEKGSFKDWIVTTFGTGIARHFMVPYNEKLWKRDLSSLSCDWVDWSIPIPSVDEVIGGALGLENQKMGYNAQFLYPERGGIGVLPQSFLPHLNAVCYKKTLISLNLQEKKAWFSDDSCLHYDCLVSTAPLPELVSMIQDIPPRVAEMGKGLKHLSVLDINLGITLDHLADQHWIYFPEPHIPFYRAGFYSHFSPSSAPPGKTSLYVELSHLPGTPLDREIIIEAAYRGLEDCGLMGGGNEIVVEDAVEIPYAYVIYDDQRRKALPEVVSYLKKHNVFTIGRYGSWKYMSMEDTLLQGKEVAEELNG
jgi:protoporphyrinogen oxidase